MKFKFVQNLKQNTFHFGKFLKFEFHHKLIYDQVLKFAIAIYFLLSGKQTFEGFERKDARFFPKPRNDLRFEILALHMMLWKLV